MKIVLRKLTLVLSLCLPIGEISSLYSVSLEFSTLGYEIQWIEKNTKQPFKPPGWSLDLGNRAGEFQEESYLFRRSGQMVALKFKDKNEYEKFNWELDAQLVLNRNDSTNSFYFGKNNYLMYKTPLSNIGVGKKEHLSKPKSFSTYSDGGEGIFVETNPSSELSIQLFLWDRYQGYPLFDKERFFSVLLRPEAPQYEKSHHRRHSFGIKYGNLHSVSFGLQYTEFGTWGKHTREREVDVKEVGADGDSIISSNISLFSDWEFLQLYFDILIVSGTDRTLGNYSKLGNSIPIRGEAFQLGLKGFYQNFTSEWSHFVTDRSERTNENQIVKEGYMLSGTHPGQSYFISQILHIFPSVGLLNAGSEKNYVLYNGRFHSYFSELVLSYQYNDIFFKLVGAYLLPYRVSGVSDGRVSLKKENYESFFFGEVNFEFFVKGNSDFEIGLGVGQFFTPKAVGIEGNFGYFFGRVIF
ncbi:hypothetical protein P3G55_05100 [Leptospira sp. 96542]|nr:hypothetical protein [Leptospira sp. 96542]